uniref:(northern house mosquito) hypothetical protein n=2 Tax=Culex pipiens TaxID=7175 RepID=A0A8D8J4S0_CULPI
MRHKWLLLMCVGVILVQATLANTEDGSNSQNEPEEGENQAEVSDQQSTQSPRTANNELVHSNREPKAFMPAVRQTTTKKPSYICTKSNLNYDCILQDVRLNHNEPNVFGLGWKDNPQKNVTFTNSRLQYLPKRLFEAFPEMELLNAEDLQIEEIEHQAFRYARTLKRYTLKEI